MIESVELLTELIGEKEYYDLFSHFMKELLVRVSLQMMTTTQSELDVMRKDPAEFVNIALDTCDK
jgi:hypothetical protein